jgi:hypothetical protein
MSQITIETLRQGKETGNVLSVSFFKMMNGYRDFAKYEYNLKQFLEKSRALPTFEVRIYTDDSASDICLRLANEYDTVTVLKYQCDFFRENNGHTGTFGTIVRFLPLFEKGLTTVWISDIDIDSVFLNRALLTHMKSNSCSVFIDSAICYDRKPQAAVKYPIVAHRFISFVRFPKQIFTRFLTRLMDGDLAEMVDTLNTFNTRKTPNEKFPYGMDEVFLNYSLYSYIQRHSYRILNRKSYFAESYILYKGSAISQSERDILTRFYKTNTQKDLAAVKRIYKKYVPELLATYPCLQELLDVLDHLHKEFELYKTLDSKEL